MPTWFSAQKCWKLLDSHVSDAFSLDEINQCSQRYFFSVVKYAPLQPQTKRPLSLTHQNQYWSSTAAAATTTSVYPLIDHMLTQQQNSETEKRSSSDEESPKEQRYSTIDQHHSSERVSCRTNETKTKQNKKKSFSQCSLNVTTLHPT